MKKLITTLYKIAFAMTFFGAQPLTSTLRAQDSNAASTQENLLVIVLNSKTELVLP